MRLAGLVSGLGTRVALRTFVSFGISAILPVALFAMIGVHFIDEELRSVAAARLQAEAKRYGVLLNERLIQAEQLMLEAARMRLEAGEAVDETSLVARMQVLTELHGENTPIHAREVGQDMLLPPGWHAVRALQADIAGAVPRVLLMVEVGDGQRTVRLMHDPTGPSFWKPDSGLAGARLCVELRGETLHCEGAVVEDTKSRPALHAAWPLFLKPRFGADEWTIRVDQPQRFALEDLRAFHRTVPIVAVLAIALALLFGSLHIRRSHGPLALLAAGADRMSRGRFREPVRISSNDEFESVGDALNRLAGRLRRQFRMLSLLARIDRQILATPTFAPVVRALLPRMPRLLGCQAAAVVTAAAEPGGQQITLWRDGKLTTLRLPGAAAVAADASRVATSDLALLSGHCPGIERWRVAPIVVKGERRGVLLAGYDAGEPRRGARRQLRGLAHRLAVALGNEDRERALVRQAWYDALTGLPNRQLFRDRLEQVVLRARREQGNAALLYLDLDQFKNVNDSFGHAAGDGLLVEVTRRLSALVPEGHTVSRLGGDEFTVICPDTTAGAAGQLASRLLESLEAPIPIAGQSWVIRASIGIAGFPRDAPDAEELMRSADAALVRAKRDGRGRVARFEDGMNSAAKRRMVVEQRLRHALLHGGLSLAFQPKVRPGDRALAGFEALARWTDEQLGAVSPAEFIAVAEESGLIEGIGAFALRETCASLRRWREAGLVVPHVAVNVSVHQLRDAGFPAYVRACLAAAGLPAGSLHVEITESTLAQESPEVIARLAELRAAGTPMAMDDFGTGYSSLAALRELPVDMLKIDRSFVVRSCEAAADEALLRSLIELAHTLGKTVVAEGVETEAQLALLNELGCDVVQGWLTGRPMPEHAVAEFLSRQAGVPQAPVAISPSASVSATQAG